MPSKEQIFKASVVVVCLVVGGVLIVYSVISPDPAPAQTTADNVETIFDIAKKVLSLGLLD